ncbi:MAG: hypothetical protein WCD86_13150 [Ktedonobacteraceae bacterium]
MMLEEQAQQRPEPSPEQPASSRKARRLAQVEALKPHPSPWPFALAASLMVLLIGFITYPVLCGIGVLLTIICIIGWSLERQ